MYKINEIVNKFLLVSDKFMPETHLKQPEFTYSASGPFTKNRKFKNLKKQEIQTVFTKMNMIEHFQHDMNVMDKMDVFNIIWALWTKWMFST